MCQFSNRCSGQTPDFLWRMKAKAKVKASTDDIRPIDVCNFWVFGLGRVKAYGLRLASARREMGRERDREKREKAETTER